MNWDRSLHNGVLYLNQYFLDIISDNTTLKIHYWGAQEKLTTNHLHQHSFYEICYVLNGEGSYFENEKFVDLKKGRLFLSRPYTKHQIISEDGISILFIGYDLEQTKSKEVYDLFKFIKTGKKFLIEDLENSGAIHLWFSVLKFAQKNNMNIINKNLSTLILTLIFELMISFQEKNPTNTALKRNSPASDTIYSAKLYIKNNLANSFTLGDVADYIHISERHLSRIFQQELGQTFSSYIKKERIRKAGILLAETNTPIKDIAENVGFNNVHYFSKVFSDELDMPPGKFRNKFQLSINKH